MHLRFDTASAVVTTPASPQSAPQVSLRTDRVVSGNSSGARPVPGSACRHVQEGVSRALHFYAGLGRLGIDPVDYFSPGRAEPWGDDSIRIAGRNRIVAFASIVSPVPCDAAYFWSGGIRLRRSVNIGASPMRLLVT